MWFQKPPLGTPLDWENPLNDGTVLALAMNEGHGDKVKDISLNGNHGTLTNFALPPTTSSGWNPGQTGIGVIYDGNNDYTSCGNNPPLNCTNALTMSVIIGHTGGGYSQRIVAKENTYALRITAADAVDVLIKSGGTIYFFTAPLSSSSIGRNVVVTSTFQAGTDVKIYENGNALTVTDVTGYAGGSIDISDKNVTIGSYTGTAQFFKGTIDQPRIQCRAWTAKEVKDYAINPWQVYLDDGGM